MSEHSSHASPSTRRSRPTVAELRERDLHNDRLWTLEDVATFLGYSVRLTEEIVKDPRVPQPRLVARGGDRRWSPSHWHDWMNQEGTIYLAGPVGDTVGASSKVPGAEMAVI